MMAPPMSVPACVEIHGLVHDYGERRVLSGLDGSVRQGEIFGLLGPNGGGKTTLFRILATLMRPTGGRALVLGHDVAREANEVRRLIGVVFQSPALDRKLTVRENLLVQGRLYGLGARQLRQASDDMLRRGGLLSPAAGRGAGPPGGLLRPAAIAPRAPHPPRPFLLDAPASRPA